MTKNGHSTLHQTIGTVVQHRIKRWGRLFNIASNDRNNMTNKKYDRSTLHQTIGTVVQHRIKRWERSFNIAWNDRNNMTNNKNDCSTLQQTIGTVDQHRIKRWEQSFNIASNERNGNGRKESSNLCVLNQLYLRSLCKELRGLSSTHSCVCSKCITVKDCQQIKVF